MSFETAEKSIELMMKSPARHVTLEFQGGEPLLAFDLIRQIVPLARKRAETFEQEYGHRCNDEFGERYR